MSSKEYLEDGEEIINEDELSSFENKEIIEEQKLVHSERKNYPQEFSKKIVMQGFTYNENISFEENLTTFFKKYRKSKLKLVPKIVEQFKGKEKEVFNHLHYKYVSRVQDIINGKRTSLTRGKK